MKLGIDISQIVYEGTGVARFTEGLVDSILENDKSNEWTFFLSVLRKQPHPDLRSKILENGHKLVEWFIPPSMLSLLWNDFHSYSSPILPDGQLVKGLDWFITSDWTEPKLHVKKATIVHDLVFKRYPETVHKQILRTQKKRIEWVAKESQIIFCDSAQTAQDLKEYYHIEADRVQVNYPGVNMKQLTLENELLTKYNISSNFILTVGKQEPRKNIARLIEAYESLDLVNKPDLVIAGMKGWGTNKKEVKGIHYLGFVTDNELVQLYTQALFFVFPTLYEGFGYPMIEAMLYGCPTAVSDTSSLKEIGADATLLFDPHDATSIKDALIRMISDDNLRKALSAKGYEIATQFTWQRYYDTLINTLSQAV